MTKMQIWSPMADLWDLQNDVNKLFRGVGFGRRNRDDETDLAVWAPLVDICEDNESVKIIGELPGLQRDDVKISVNDGVLTIKGERKFKDEKKKDNYHRVERAYGCFSRSFNLPVTVDAEKIKANMKDGLLELYIPKKEEAKPKEIQIEVK